ncbi:MAG: glycerol dehydrogenase [Pseudomonadota bacterium]|nr:glycerol dehydrogenase [Pseudomonadota bacterium]
MSTRPYLPAKIFSSRDEITPRVMVAPQRYIQGPGVLNHINRYMSLLNVKRVGILASRRGQAAEGQRISKRLSNDSIDCIPAVFAGECSLEEVEKHVRALAGENLDCLISVGGGKPVDAGKSIAYRLDIPVVIVPTLASNDAPTSALSVLYTTEGANDAVEFYPSNPAMVIVDTEVIAAAGERYFVAGIGDAMATWFESRVCFENSSAITPIGARPTLASYAIGEVCARTLFEKGEAASRAVATGACTDEVESVVEANTLLSGIGFESGGLALAHPVALAFTQLDEIHRKYLHGEMVAMGTLIQLTLERSVDAEKVARFFANIGLPIHMTQLSLSPKDSAAISAIIEATLGNRNAHHMPMPVTYDSLREAMLDANKLGMAVTAEVGDDAYRRLHTG